MKRGATKVGEWINNVGLEQLSVSTNVGQKSLLIVPLDQHHYASLQIVQIMCFS